MTVSRGHIEEVGENWFFNAGCFFFGFVLFFSVRLILGPKLEIIEVVKVQFCHLKAAPDEDARNVTNMQSFPTNQTTLTAGARTKVFQYRHLPSRWKHIKD